MLVERLSHSYGNYYGFTSIINYLLRTTATGPVYITVVFFFWSDTRTLCARQVYKHIAACTLSLAGRISHSKIWHNLIHFDQRGTRYFIYIINSLALLIIIRGISRGTAFRLKRFDLGLGWKASLILKPQMLPVPTYTPEQLARYLVPQNRLRRLDSVYNPGSRHLCHNDSIDPSIRWCQPGMGWRCPLSGHPLNIIKDDQLYLT